MMASQIVPHVHLFVCLLEVKHHEKHQGLKFSLCVWAPDVKESSNHVCCWGECVTIRKTCEKSHMWSWDDAGQLCELKSNENIFVLYLMEYLNGFAQWQQIFVPLFCSPAHGLYDSIEINYMNSHYVKTGSEELVWASNHSYFSDSN